MSGHRTLSRRAYLRLTAGTPAVLVTVGADGYANAVMTWAVAVAADAMRFCVDHDTNTHDNVRREHKASLHICADPGVLVLVKGAVHQIRERVQAAPFAMAMWEMAVEEVRDQTWDGVVVQPMVYGWVGPRAAELRLIEQAVLDEMREFDEG